MLKITIGKTDDACLLWHRWNLVAEIGHMSYFKCKDCSSRKAVQQSDGYQPINWDWLEGITDIVAMDNFNPLDNKEEK